MNTADMNIAILTPGERDFSGHYKIYKSTGYAGAVSSAEKSRADRFFAGTWQSGNCDVQRSVSVL